jgi:DnaK suppressor protein
MATEKTRYSDKELQEFKEIINKKLEDARKELTNLQAALNSSNEHGTDDTASTFKVLEDGSDTLANARRNSLSSWRMH